MLKNKSQIITAGLLVITLGLVIAIIYISQVITSESKTGEVKNVAPQKTKAANIAYDKTVVLANTPTPEATVMPTAVTPTGLAVSPTGMLPSVTIAPTINSLLAYNNASISPTEIILAYNNTTVTPTSSDYSASSLSATTVKSSTLPESGFINNAIIMFVAAGLIIFFAFMF